jgi:hypothetical protein
MPRKVVRTGKPQIGPMGIQLKRILSSKLPRLIGGLGTQGKDDATRVVVIPHIKRHPTQEDKNVALQVRERDRIVLQNVLRWPVVNTKANENNKINGKVVPLKGIRVPSFSVVPVVFAEAILLLFE